MEYGDIRTFIYRLCGILDSVHSCIGSPHIPSTHRNVPCPDSTIGLHLDRCVDHLHAGVHTNQTRWVFTGWLQMTPIRSIQNLISRYLPVVTPIPTLTYTSKYFTPFNNASWDFSKMSPILFSVLGDFFGVNGNTIVYGTIFVTIIGIIWIRQENVAVPLFLTFILSNTLFMTPGLFPVEWVWVVQALMNLCLAGFAYVTWRGRRTS